MSAGSAGGPSPDPGFHRTEHSPAAGAGGHDEQALLPDWLHRLATGVAGIDSTAWGRYSPPDSSGRRAAVLMLFGETAIGPDLLFIERARTLRKHAGQAAFPGGATDATDTGPAGTALREAVEEVGLDPEGVTVFAQLPELWVPPTAFRVVPVLAWWAHPSPVSVVDTAEVARVDRIPIAELSAPANRCLVRHPSGWIGPAFDVADLLVWGFTALLVDEILRLGGWELPWQPEQIRELPRWMWEPGPRELEVAEVPAEAAAELPAAGLEAEDLREGL